MGAMRRPAPHHLLAVIVLTLSCGRPTLRSVTRRQLTVDENVVTRDARGEEIVRLVLHDRACPSARDILTVPTSSRETADCLRALAVGRAVEDVHAIYRFPLLSCGQADGDPKSGLAGCPVENISYSRDGTPCPEAQPGGA
jgi:hypothetical protein